MQSQGPMFRLPTSIEKAFSAPPPLGRRRQTDPGVSLASQSCYDGGLRFFEALGLYAIKWKAIRATYNLEY